MSKKIIGIIPARYNSSRFPGKPLIKILGKPMVLWVAELSSKALGRENLFIATDDERIKNTATKINNIFFPDRFIDHQSPESQYSEIGMDAKSIARKIKQIYENNIISFQSYNKKIKN